MLNDGFESVCGMGRGCGGFKVEESTEGGGEGREGSN